MLGPTTSALNRTCCNGNFGLTPYRHVFIQDYDFPAGMSYLIEMKDRYDIKTEAALDRYVNDPTFSHLLKQFGLPDIEKDSQAHDDLSLQLDGISDNKFTQEEENVALLNSIDNMTVEESSYNENINIQHSPKPLEKIPIKCTDITPHTSNHSSKVHVFKSPILEKRI